MKTINISKSKRIWLPVAGALLATGCLFLHFASPWEQERAATDTAVVNGGAPPAAPARRPTGTRRYDAPSAPANLDLRQNRPTPADRMHPVMKSALEGDPEMAHYYWLAQKVLPTEEHRRMREEMLSDIDLIQKARADLIASSESTFTREAEAKRMISVEFLADAIAWEGNPEIEAVVEAIEDVLFAENISSETPDDLAKSLAGDKMDLYTQTLHTSPDRAAAIADRARGREVEALLTYSKEWYDSELMAMRADELP